LDLHILIPFFHRLQALLQAVFYLAFPEQTEIVQMTQSRMRSFVFWLNILDLLKAGLFGAAGFLTCPFL
jgi:hypothetical protein